MFRFRSHSILLLAGAAVFVIAARSLEPVLRPRRRHRVACERHSGHTKTGIDVWKQKILRRCAASASASLRIRPASIRTAVERLTCWRRRRE